MHRHYSDILDRIADPPIWFDENAVPRYCEFTRRAIANIYANEAVLVLICCQGCKREFRVAFSEMNTGEKLWSADRKTKLKTISDLIRDGSLHYGDPPNVDCCETGATMNSVPVRVIEYWYRPTIRGEGVKPDPKNPGWNRITDIKALDFHRDPGLEISIKLDWWTE